MNLPRLNLKRILVPVTLTAESWLALPEAVRLVKKYGGEITLLHVVKLSIVGEERGIPRRQMCDGLCDEAKATLRRLADEFTDADVAIEVEALPGDPGRTIVEVATEMDADLIVMNRRRHRGFGKLFRRKTADYVLRNAGCPVWLACTDERADGVTIIVDGNVQKSESESYEDLHSSPRLLRV